MVQTESSSAKGSPVGCAVSPLVMPGLALADEVVVSFEDFLWFMSATAGGKMASNVLVWVTGPLSDEICHADVPQL